MKKLVLAMCIMASTSALASNEMYALGGVGIDSGDVGGQFTFGSQIMHSNWHVESTLLAISLDDTYSYNNGNDTIEKKEKFDTLMFSVAPMYKHSFSNNFAIFGKAGLFFSHSDTKLTFNYSNQNSEVSKGSHSDIGLTYGIGAEYKSTQPVFGNSKLLTRVGFDWYEFGGSSGWYTTESVLGIQAGFTF